MKEIYFVRHGQSQANARNAYAGWDDVGLTDMGREQAKAVASVIKDLDIDAIICSDLSRSHETANIIADSIDFKGEVRVDPRLREVGLGQLSGTSPDKGIKEYLLQATDGVNAMGVEPVNDCMVRARALLKDVLDDPSQRVLLVGHGGIKRFLQLVVDGQEADSLERIINLPDTPNAHLVKLYPGETHE
jgi:broad specificity phosphatase PhoE